MKKEKVYCHSCIFYIPEGKSYSGIWIRKIPDKCTSPIAFKTRKIKATYKEPAHDQGYIERPRELNYKNDCKGYYFGMHKDRLSKRKKSW